MKSDCYLSKWKTNIIVNKYESKADSALKVVGGFLAGRAKELTPRISSRLINSISWAVKGGSPQDMNDQGGEQKAKAKEGVRIPTNSFSVNVGTSVNYAEYVEFGTHRTHKSGSKKSTSKGGKAQAFLRLALFSNKANIMRLLKGELKK